MTDAWIPAKEYFALVSRGVRTKGKDTLRIKLILAMAAEEKAELLRQVEELKKQVSE